MLRDLGNLSGKMAEATKEKSESARHVYVEGVHRKGTKRAVEVLNEKSGDCLRAVVLGVDDLREKALYERSHERIHLSPAQRKDSEMLPWKLVESRDCWWQVEYVETVKTKRELSLKDLEQIMIWKISRSKWRPLLNGIRKNKPSDVRKHTKKAFEEMRAAIKSSNDNERARAHVKAAFDALVNLKYVGPVTATAILAPVYPKLIAYACDETLEALGFRREVRSTKDLMVFQTKAFDVARAYGLTPFELSEALWVAAWSDDESIESVKEWLVGACDFAGGHRGEFAAFNAFCRSQPGFLL